MTRTSQSSLATPRAPGHPRPQETLPEEEKRVPFVGFVLRTKTGLTFCEKTRHILRAQSFLGVSREIPPLLDPLEVPKRKNRYVWEGPHLLSMTDVCMRVRPGSLQPHTWNLRPQSGSRRIHGRVPAELGKA